MGHFKLANPKGIADRDFWVTISLLVVVSASAILAEIVVEETPVGYLCDHRVGVQTRVAKRERTKCELVKLPHP